MSSGPDTPRTRPVPGSRSPKPGSYRGRLPWVLGCLAAWYLCVLHFLPAWCPYAGQEALDGLKFSLRVLDKAGDELQVRPLAEGLHRLWLAPHAIPQGLEEIVLGAEDRRFWWHPGVDPLSLIRALGQNLASQTTVSGASTITMQLARLLVPRSRTLDSKLAEIWEALQLEARLDKGEILALYLSLLPFGRNVEGFPAAARTWFGRGLSELDDQELMALAVIPRSPGLYDPWTSPLANATARGRLNRALGRSTVSTSDPKALPGLKDPARLGIWPFRAPHFVTWLATRPEVQSLDGRQALQTSLEPRLQQRLEQLVERELENAGAKRISNAAALFVRPKTMEIAAWVGSHDFHDAQRSGQVDGVLIQRQPGSTLKPFLYALALEQGFTPSTILPDIPSDFGGQEVYVPANFNQQFNGPVRLRQALASSLNVPAVHTLQRLGVSTLLDFLQANGFASLGPQRGHLGLGLALGNAEISLYELVQGYGIFLNQGRPAQLRAWPKPETQGETPRTDHTGFGESGPQGIQLLEPRTAWLIQNMLARSPDRILGFGRSIGGDFDFAMKTGTSSQFNNIWAVGFTPDLLGGVWMGNFNGDTVRGAPGSSLPATVLVQTLDSGSTHPAFAPAAGLVQREICSLSGKQATPACPHCLKEYFVPGTEPAPCDWHRREASGRVEVHYPQEYRTWLERYRYRASGQWQTASVTIRRPLDNALFYLDPGLAGQAQDFRLEATGPGEALVFLDGRAVYRGSFPLGIWLPLTEGIHRLEVEDQSGAREEIGFTVKP